MKGTCQMCGMEVNLINLNRKENHEIDDAAIHGEKTHTVVEDHNDPRGEYCDGSLAMPEKIIY